MNKYTPRKFKDLSGKKFSRLLIIKRDLSKIYKRPYYLCKCDCGKELIICGTSLTRNNGHTLSCGCAKEDYFNKIRLPEGESVFNSLFNSYKRAANKRKIEFNINKSFFSILFLKRL
jgi:hypothetical protein